MTDFIRELYRGNLKSQSDGEHAELCGHDAHFLRSKVAFSRLATRRSNSRETSAHESRLLVS